MMSGSSSVFACKRLWESNDSPSPFNRQARTFRINDDNDLCSLPNPENNQTCFITTPDGNETDTVAIFKRVITIQPSWWVHSALTLPLMSNSTVFYVSLCAPGSFLPLPPYPFNKDYLLIQFLLVITSKLVLWQLIKVNWAVCSSPFLWKHTNVEALLTSSWNKD